MQFTFVWVRFTVERSLYAKQRGLDLNAHTTYVIRCSLLVFELDLHLLYDSLCMIESSQVKFVYDRVKPSEVTSTVAKLSQVKFVYDRLACLSTY